MKTLVNKNNPQIRITAPDGTVKNRTNCWAIWSEGNRLMLLDKDNWTLVEEEEFDLEKDVESWFFNEISPKINVENTMYHYFQECAHRYYNLGLNARKEE